MSSNSHDPSSNCGLSPDCPRCGKPTFYQDNVVHEGRLWHRNCFTCFNCGLALKENQFWFIGNTGRLECNECAFRHKGRHLSYCLADAGFPAEPRGAPMPLNDGTTSCASGVDQRWQGAQLESKHCHNQDHYRRNLLTENRMQPYIFRPQTSFRSHKSVPKSLPIPPRKPPPPPPPRGPSANIAARAHQIENQLRHSKRRRRCKIRRCDPRPTRYMARVIDYGHQPIVYDPCFHSEHCYYSNTCGQHLNNHCFWQRPPSPPRPLVVYEPQPRCSSSSSACCGHPNHHIHSQAGPCCPDSGLHQKCICRQCMDCELCAKIEEESQEDPRYSKEGKDDEDDEEADEEEDEEDG